MILYQLSSGIRHALCSGEILAASGVNLDLIADVAEQRYCNLCTGFYRSRLGCTGSGVSLKTRLRLGNLKLYEHRRLDCKYIAVVGINLNHVVLFDELHVAAADICAKADLLIGLYK